MATEMSLGEFVKQLATRLQDKGVTMPFRNEHLWHLLFYQLAKTKEVSEKPEFLERLRFDWDGPFPKSQELSDFIQALHWTASVSASNPRYDVITLPDDIAALWRKRLEAPEAKEISEFLEYTVGCAQNEFAKMESAA